MPKRSMALPLFERDKEQNFNELTDAAGEEDRTQPRLRPLKLWQIEPDPDHPRQVILEDDILTLAASIRQHGIQQPILARRIPGTYRYIIIDGVIRFRAAQRCNLEEVPAHVIVCNDPRLVYMLLELTHKRLHPVDMAENIVQATASWNGSEGDLAEILQKSQSVISRSKRINSLSPDVKAAMRNRDVSLSVAYEISDAVFSDKDRIELLTKPDVDLSTEQLRSEIQKRQRKPDPNPTATVIKRRLRAARDFVRWLQDDHRVGGEGLEPGKVTLDEVMAFLEADLGSIVGADFAISQNPDRAL